MISIKIFPIEITSTTEIKKFQFTRFLSKFRDQG